MHPPEGTDARLYRRRVWAWALYDVGNSAFYLTIVSSFFQFFFIDLYVQAHGPADAAAEAELRQRGGAALGFTAGTAMAAVAVLGPFLGIVADRTASKKKFLAAFAALGIAASALMFFIPPGGWRAAAALYALGTVGVAGSLVFYDALLPGVAREEDLDRVSALGYALGYGGSVVLFFVNVLLYLKPDLLGIADRGTAVRLAFVSVAVWWGLFTIPVLRGVPEPPAAAAGRPGLVRAVRDLARFRSLLLFLAAFWIYADGIGTIIKLAAGFGYMLKLDQKDLLLALVIPQVLGVPCSLAFGRLAGRVGAKRAILLGLAGYAAVCLLAWGIRKPWHFYALAAGVGLVQGGTQALSRSLFALLVPQGRTAEFFGLFSTVEKFAGIVGPFLLGAIWSRGGDPRPGILALVVFFAAGAAVLAGVDVEKGRRQAEEAL
jgi:UMF1 family MFS transporter